MEDKTLSMSSGCCSSWRSGIARSSTEVPSRAEAVLPPDAVRGRVIRILIVGDYPPPYGGLSVQISALQRRLSETPGYTGRVLDIGESRRQQRPECLAARNAIEFAWRLASHAARQYVIHLHTSGHNVKSWLVGGACAAAGLVNGRRTVISLGSGLAPEFVRSAGPATRALIKATLALTQIIICRNERTRNAMIALGVPAERIAVLSGFYGVPASRPPEVPSRITEFLHRHFPVLAAMATGGPEYGIPLVVEAASRLRAGHPRLGVLLIGAEAGAERSSDSHVLHTGDLTHDVVLDVMRTVGVFVRPTYFDGDATSVREALALGVPVVASDTDFRPEGVVLFRRGDAEDLTEKLADLLAAGPAGGGPSRPAAGALGSLLAVYDRLAGRRGRSPESLA
jgi:glycogen synthase